MTITQATERSAINPLATPAHYGALGDTLRLCLSDEVFGFELIGKEREEDGFLIQRFYRWKRDVLCAFDKLEGLRHVEDEFVTNEFGGGVIRIGAEDIIRTFVRISGRRHHAESGEDHGDTLDMDGHTEAASPNSMGERSASRSSILMLDTNMSGFCGR